MTSTVARLAVVFSLLWGMSAMCAAQDYTPPPPPLTTLPPCPVDKNAKKHIKRKDCDPTVYPSEALASRGKPSAAATQPPAEHSAKQTPAEAHPYPGDSAPAAPPGTSAAATHPYPGDNAPDVPHDPAAEKRAADTPAGKANPFPGGATPDMPTDAVGPTDNPNPGSVPSDPASSGSSSSSSGDAVPADPDSATKGAAARNPDDDEDKPRLTDKGSEGGRGKKVPKPQSDTERVDEDLSIAEFYGQSGNYMGAYLRAKDAVTTQPDYPEGHFALGEAARRLNKKSEAVAEFQAYLRLSPEGRQAKVAEKALRDLK